MTHSPPREGADTQPDLIVFSHIRWDFVVQRPQHLLSRLAQSRRVFVVEEPVRSDGPPRLERSMPCLNVHVLRPHTPSATEGFADDQLPMLRQLLAALMQEQGIEAPVAWLSTPMALPLLAPLRPVAVVYDCMAEWLADTGVPPQLREREDRLLGLADVVLAGGPSLYEARRARHPNVHCLASGVDARHFAPRAVAPAPWDERRAEISPGAMASMLQDRIPGPRLGFFGVIDRRLDLDLVAALADADPGWQLVMVGPVSGAQAALPQRPNLHWLRQQPYTVLPELVAGWDVCLLPYALDASTRYICPSKTLEYMAAGKPVVSTGVRDVRRLYGAPLRFGDTPAAFIDACRAALHETADERAARVDAMRACLASRSWDDCAQQVERLIADAVAQRRRHLPRRAVPAARRAGLATPQGVPALGMPIAETG